MFWPFKKRTSSSTFTAIHLKPDICAGAFSVVNGESFAGRHILLDMWGASPDKLSSVQDTLRILRRAAEACNATVLHRHCYPFPGGGVSAVAVLAESHISIHTWPEKGVVTIDAFMCGQCLPSRIIPIFNAFYKPEAYQWKEIKRASSNAELLARKPRGPILFSSPGLT